MDGLYVGKRKPLPHRAVDDGVRIVPREDRAEHVERTDIRCGLAASVRARGKDKIPELLLQHGDIIPKSGAARRRQILYFRVVGRRGGGVEGCRPC